jgi:hypothetical protein
MAQPGQYTVRLSIGTNSYTAPVTVKMDPRVKVSLAALREQFDLENRLAELLSKSSQATIQARSALQQIQKLSTQSAGTESAKALEKKLQTLLDGSDEKGKQAAAQTTLSRSNGEVGTLYGLAGQSDSAPTAAITAAAITAERDLSTLLKQWNEVEQTDIPALNQQLRQGSQPEIRLETNVYVDEVPRGDEE